MTADPNAIPLAPRGRRLGAALLDWLVSLGAVLVAAAIFWTARGAVGNTFTIGLAAVVVAAVMVYQMALIATTGQSLGKRWLGLEIVRNDGRPPGFLRGVLLRVIVPQLIGAIPALFLSGAAAEALGEFPNALFGNLNITGVIGLVDVLLIFTPSRRCLHDYLAGTRVTGIHLASGGSSVRVNHLRLAAIGLFLAPPALVAPWLLLYVPSCLGARKDCDGSWLTMCESDLDSVTSCGDCGVLCGDDHATSSACVNRRCVVTCEKGYGNCDGYSGNGCETDLASDGAHCGSCGGDCRGATCEQGVCGARLVGRGAAIAVDDTAVYALWNGVVQYPLDGAAAVVVVPGGDGNEWRDVRPYDLVIDERRIYWISMERERILSVPIGGGPVTTLADGLGSVWQVLLDRESLFWVDGSSDRLRVKRVPTYGGTVSVALPGQFFGGHRSTLAVEASDIFWTGRDPVKTEDVIWVLRPGAKRPEKLVSNTLVVGSIAADAANIYWVHAPSSMMTVRRAGGTPERLATVSAPMPWILVDDVHVYWVEYLPGDGSLVRRVARQGGNL